MENSIIDLEKITIQKDYVRSSKLERIQRPGYW